MKEMIILDYMHQNFNISLKYDLTFLQKHLENRLLSQLTSSALNCFKNNYVIKAKDNDDFDINFQKRRLHVLVPCCLLR